MGFDEELAVVLVVEIAVSGLAEQIVVVEVPAVIVEHRVVQVLDAGASLLVALLVIEFWLGIDLRLVARLELLVRRPYSLKLVGGAAVVRMGLDHALAVGLLDRLLARVGINSEDIERGRHIERRGSGSKRVLNRENGTTVCFLMLCGQSLCMVEYFDTEFNNIGRPLAKDLQTLEDQGCTYVQFWRKEIEEFGFCRVQFEPGEIVEYVDAMRAYDEYRGNVDQGYKRDEALKKISSAKFRRRVEKYNEWTEKEGQPETKYSPAAFYGEELESLVCGTREDRYEFLQESYSGDRKFLLTEIIEGFAESASILQDRDGGRPNFEITCEQDFQDLFYALIKPIFPDARPEEYTPKHATNSKRIDFVIPEISTVIEAKYVRDSSHANSIADELKVDIGSYHKHTDCNRMIAVVWDGKSYISDRVNFENDLTGPRVIDGVEFQVEVEVVP